MKERPIIFSSEMVRAILCGRKSQTRRIIKPQPDGERRPLSEWSLGLAAACHDHSPDPAKLAAHSARMEGRIFPFSTRTGGLMSPVCPYGVPGDKLWVRETWAHDGPDLETVRSRLEDAICGWATYGPYYRATETAPDTLRWRSPIHMPRWASRITLEVTGVRVERLQEISEDDAKAEGVMMSWAAGQMRAGTWRQGYRLLWDSINGKPHIERDDDGRRVARHDYSWGANPWVWVIEFKRAE